MPTAPRRTATPSRQPRNDLHIRWMIRRDMPETLDIEALSFPGCAWSEEDFIRCLRQRNAIGMVIEDDYRVVGFMIYELHRDRLHLLNFAVHPEHRCQGIGSALVRKLVGKLSLQRRRKIVLEIREKNLAAQLFFAGQGFRAVSILRNFYMNSPQPVDEDAFVFEYRLTSAAEV